ncbi:MAG: aminoglycoside phosphotransferase family protein [Actinomycetota bacterium]|nr:aminoglycoside phosphotransferase family protein [Actinomycetota bacterium]
MGKVLTSGERRAVEALLGGPVDDEEIVWERAHVVRVRTASGHAIVKRPRAEEEGRSSFLAELVGLEFLAAMPGNPAPALFGADVEVGRAEADLIAYARSLAAVHKWSIDQEHRFRALRLRVGLPVDGRVRWTALAAAGVPGLRAVAIELGVDVPASFDDECGVVVEHLGGDGGWRGLVHGDPCPDNVRFTTDGVRIFDLEHAGYGSVVLDASYLIAPFPTCWCIGHIPPEISGQALDAYRQVLDVAADEEWRDALSAGLAAWTLARGHVIAKAVVADGTWGTTTMRPRLLQWMEAFLTATPPDGCFAGLRYVVAGIRQCLGAAWPDVQLGSYPALASTGGPDAVAPPDWWQPSS